MCPSCPPSRNICYLCGADHAAADGSRALVPAAPAAVAQGATPGTLAGMPVVIGSQILSFEPDAARAFQVASRTLQRMSTQFMVVHSRAIDALYASSHSTLYSFIHDCFVFFQPDSGALQPTHIRFLLSVPMCIRQLGAQRFPDNVILSTQTIEHFNQVIEDYNLRRIWCRIRRPVTVANPALQRVPAANGQPLDIRRWMHAAENQPLLQGLTRLNLDALQLTCVPEELGLCAGLQELSLQNNYLSFLPEDRFRGMMALRRLEIARNRIDSLQEGLFRGLTALRVLNLHSLYCFSQGRVAPLLPPGLFQGLTALEFLSLGNNHLVSLPEETFQGLTSLRRISAAYNQIGPVSEEFFQQLPALQELHFSGNPGSLVAYDNRLLELYDTALRRRTPDFFNYACQSAFARFYQLAARGSSAAAMREAFLTLPDAIKNAIYGKVWVEAGSPATGDSQWGEHHVFDRMDVFYRALKRYVRDSFEHLSVDERNAVYGHVYDLARNEPGAGAVNFDAYNWGEVHAFDNILRLIDAIMRLQR